MKTPMQELIEIIKKRQEDDDAMPFMYNDRIIELAESLLEKEKKQIMDAYMEGGDWESLPQPRFDNYYNITLNTKEK